MDLFEYAREKQKETESPLASRLRPETLEEVVGQQHIIGKDKPRQGDRKCHQRKNLPDQCHGGWEEGYGSGR